MSETENTASISRRHLMAGAGAVATAMAVGQAQASSSDAHGHHGGAALNKGLLAAMANCVSMGQVCIHHCIEAYKGGDLELADCLAAVQQMLPACAAGAQLTALDSPFLKDYLKPSLLICEACEKECRKHADKHPECKACAEACKTCIEESKKALAA